jgi:RNA polymerase sigma factor
VHKRARLALNGTFAETGKGFSHSGTFLKTPPKAPIHKRILMLAIFMPSLIRCSFPYGIMCWWRGEDMLGYLFITKKRKQTLENTALKIQQGDSLLLNELIESYKPFIAKTVSSVCRRYIHESDDEFSIGLIAFDEAIHKYSPEKGSSLLSFAEIIIKRRVIDYIRQQARHNNVSFDGNRGKDDEQTSASLLEDRLSLEEFVKKSEEELRREEILHVSALLKEYGLTFAEVADQSPKHADARRNAMEIASALVSDKELSSYLKEKKRLPIKQLEGSAAVSRKTIERNRKYIIAVSLILLGDYVFLQEYIKGVLKP